MAHPEFIKLPESQSKSEDSTSIYENWSVSDLPAREKNPGEAKNSGHKHLKKLRNRLKKPFVKLRDVNSMGQNDNERKSYTDATFLGSLFSKKLGRILPMASQRNTSRPLPAEPGDYEDAGFAEDEFDDDYEIHGNTPEDLSDDDNYLEPTETAASVGNKPSLPPREPTRGCQIPPSPRQNTGPPDIIPRMGKASADAGRMPSVLPPRQSSSLLSLSRGNPTLSRAAVPEPQGDIYEVVPEEAPSQRSLLNQKQSAPLPSPPDDDDDLSYEEPPTELQETYEELPTNGPQETYEDMKDVAISRPQLPPPMLQQDEYLAPEAEELGPTEAYSEVPTGIDPNLNRRAPPPPHPPSDELYQEMPEMSEELQLSSMQREIQGMKLKKSANRELPNLPPQKQKVKGFQMIEGLDSLRLKGVMTGLRPVANFAFEEKIPNERESTKVDPCVIDFHLRAAMFDKKATGQSFQPKAKLQPVLRDDKPSPRSSTGSNRSDSGVDIRDGNRELPPENPSSRQKANQPIISMPDQHREPTNMQNVSRTLPPLPPGESALPKNSLISRPLPNVPNVKNITAYNWFFGDIGRHEAKAKINAKHVNGAFLIRNSVSEKDNPYTLCLFFKTKVWNLHIRLRSDGMYAIGSEKYDEECFDSIPQLVEYHRDHCIILAGEGGGETRLTQHPVK